MTDQLTLKISQFLDSLPAAAPSPHTRRQYAMVLHRWLAFAPPSPTADDARLFLTSLRAAGLRDASVAAFDRVLRVFYARLEADGGGEDIMRRVRRVRTSHHLPKAASADTFGRMVATAVIEVVAGPLRERGLRDLTLLVWLADTGSRAAEAATVRRADVDLAARLAVVTGKGNRQRYVAISPLLADLLRCWIELRRQVWLEQEHPELFCGLSGRGPLTAPGVSEVLHHLALRAGVADLPHRAHAWRHFCATGLIRNGGGLYEVAELLGHTSVTVTRGYLHLLPADMRAMHDRSSPVAALLSAAVTSSPRSTHL